MSTPQSEDDLKTHFDEQIDFLLTSVLAYDEGKKSEAKRLATTLRTLLHSTKDSHGLLQQLGIHNRQFCDTAMPYDPATITTYSGLIYTVTNNSGGEYQPILDTYTDALQWRDFDTWWQGTTILVDIKKNSFTRRDIILRVTNQDGGAHVDPELREDYAQLSRANSLGRLYGDGNTWQTFENPQLATIRQIAHEVLKTLEIPNYSPQPKAASGFAVGPIHIITKPVFPPEWKKTPRNALCPCGSGKKFKHCHMRQIT
jgi:hypothetical protein